MSFRYTSTDAFILSGLSIDVESGCFLAVTGRSGAGKSTLGRLLIGLERPSEGTILIDGQSPPDFIEDHPGEVAYVPQDIHLIRGTIAENVALGCDASEINRDRVRACLKLAQASELESLGQGIDMSLVDTNLSGGQKQRLGIARALYTKPKLIIFDEPTSALDSQTELGLVATLLTLKKAATLIVIAHREATISAADRILNLA